MNYGYIAVVKSAIKSEAQQKGDVKVKDSRIFEINGTDPYVFYPGTISVLEMCAVCVS